VLIAHRTLVTPTELAMLKETDTAIAYSPVASQ
jgi:5-methylthioadenosine/S-adenosylhomocysteine deaminase